MRSQVEKFPSFHPQASWWKRLLLGFEEHVAPDASGRVLMSSGLRLHAKLEREAMLVGQGHYFELWDSGVWSAKLAAALSGFRHAAAGHGELLAVTAGADDERTRIRERLAHRAVLLEEAVAALAIRADGIYVDATFGRGGHSRAILERLGPGRAG